MKITYKLEIHYLGSDELGNKINRKDVFLYDSDNSVLNRQNAIKDYINYSDVFNEALQFEKLKLSWGDILNKNLSEFHIPTMNIFYCENEYDENGEIVLFGSLLENFKERLSELIDERDLYDKNDISYDYEILTDFYNNSYKIIKGSLINANDEKLIKNLS